MMRKKVLECIVIILIFINLILLGNIVIKSFSTDNQKIDLEVTPNGEEKYIELNWNVLGSNAEYNDGEYIGTTDDYNYRVYSKSEDKKEFETVGTVDYQNGEKVRVLNVYPDIGNVLKGWMENNGYGKGMIQVDAVPISYFNDNPSAYLGTSDNWKYDVIMFGTWDANNGMDLSVASSALTKQFIESGRGAVFGHDTIALVKNESVLYHPNFAALAKYVNIVNRGYWTNNRTSSVYLDKDGIFTSFPWDIGKKGTYLTIPPAHNLDQNAYGNIWIRFNNNILAGSQNFYLTTWKNCAMIQTGDSNAQATDDEQKILANVIFYVKQITTKNTVKDYSGIDLNAPNKVENVTTEFDEQGNINIIFDPAEDNGTKYTYYVEGTHKKNNTTIISENKTVDMVSGVKGYAYVINNSKTIDKSQISTDKIITEPKINVSGMDITKGNYLHIVTVDNAGNVSEVSTIELKYSYKTKINVINKIDNNIKIKNVKMKVITKSTDGNIISEEEVTTDENGLVEISNELLLNKKVICTIIPLEVPVPYKNDIGREIEISVDTKGNISVEDSEGNATVDNVGKNISLNFNIDVKKINLQIENVASENENIKLSNVGFKVEDSEIKTDENGKAETEILAKSEGTYNYTIEEKDVPKNYNGIGKENLTITYDTSGNITNVKTTNEKIIVEKFDN